jgi:endo-alpha-1,4-polygalactosaminidase (GH114 family)
MALLAARRVPFAYISINRASTYETFHRNHSSQKTPMSHFCCGSIEWSDDISIQTGVFPIFQFLNRVKVRK